VTDSSLFLRLKDERKRLGLKQTEMSALAGVSRETWSRYESGGIGPGVEVLVAIAAAGADVQYVLTGRRGVPAMTEEQERAGYRVEVLSPSESQALAALRASGVLGVNVNISGNAGQAAGIIQGDMNGTSRGKRRPR